MTATGLSKAGKNIAFSSIETEATKEARRKALPAAGFSLVGAKAVPKPISQYIDADRLPLNVKYSVALEENTRLKAEVERLKKLNAAQATELDILRAKFLSKQVTLDG